MFYNDYLVTVMKAKEDHEGITIDDSTGELNIEIFPYPVKKGEKRLIWINDRSYELSVTSVTETITTPAGTFEDVVVLEVEDDTMYFAPNVGLISATSDGETIFQLTRIHDKSEYQFE